MHFIGFRIEQLGKQMADVWSQILYYWSRRFYQEEDRIIHVIMDYNPRHQYELVINLQMGIHINIHCCSVAQSWLTLCDSMDCSMPGFPVLYHLLEHAQTHVHWVGDAIQPSCPLSFSSPPAVNLSQHQHLFLPWVSSSQVSQGTGASASVLPVNIQDWFPLRLAG